MAEQVDSTMLIAWIDGELDPQAAARIAGAVAVSPALAAQADAHRQMKQRFALAFGPIAGEPVAMPPPATVVSLSEKRAARATAWSQRRRWEMLGAIAASLIVGLAVGAILETPMGVYDNQNALLLSRPIAAALDSQTSGQPGPIIITLSFRDREGSYCRSFDAIHVSGIACQSPAGWVLRYSAPTTRDKGSYRTAGEDGVRSQVVDSLIAGDPLDLAGEQKARAKGWR